MWGFLRRAIAVGLLSWCSGSLGAPAATCPAGTFKSDPVVWQGSDVEGVAHFVLSPAQADGIVQIPAGVNALTVEAQASVRVGLQLIDPATHTAIVDRDGIINEQNKTGTYEGMTIAWDGHEGSPSSETCSVLGVTTIPLELRFRNDESGLTFVTFTYRFAGVPNPAVPPAGCVSYDELATCQTLMHWSKMVQSQYPAASGGANAAWDGLAAPHAEPGASAGEVFVPWFQWSSVYQPPPTSVANGAAATSQADAHAAFYKLDENQDSRITKDEFVAGYHFATDGAVCQAPLGDAWWTNWVTWAAVGLFVWLVGVLFVLWCFRPPKGATTYTLLGRAGAGTPLKVKEGSPRTVNVPDGPHRSTYERILKDDTLRHAIEAHPAALRFHQARVLGYHEHMEDGFVVSFARELLLVDARHDLPLQRFVEFTRASVRTHPGNPAADISTVAKAVAAALGGSAGDDTPSRRGIASRFDKRLQANKQSGAELMQIGQLFGQSMGVGEELGAGLQRHRAVLFKYVCDTLRMCETALLWDVRRDAVVAIPLVGTHPMVVDFMEDPGALVPGDDMHRLVQQESAKQPSTSPFRLLEVPRATMQRQPPAPPMPGTMAPPPPFPAVRPGHKVQLAVSPLFSIMGMTAYHSSVVVDGTEYFFGDAGIQTSQGLQSHENPQKPDQKATVLDMGTSPRTGPELKAALDRHFAVGTYDLLTKNCNAFSDCALYFLQRKRLDSKYCILEGLGASNVDLAQHASGGQYKPNPKAAGYSTDKALASMDAESGGAPARADGSTSASPFQSAAGSLDAATLRILIKGANQLTKSSTYATCSIVDQPSSKLTTRVARGTSEPTWQYEGEIAGFRKGHVLRFDVWNEDPDGPDTHLGTARLTGQQLGAFGFDDQLPLSHDDGRAAGGSLAVRVTMSDAV